MFRPLGLLSTLACPDHDTGKCVRPSCPFSHDVSKAKDLAPFTAAKRSAPQAAAAVPAKRRAAQTHPAEESASALVSKAPSIPTSRASTTAVPIGPELKKPKNAYTSKVASKAESSSASEWSTVGLKPPTIGFKEHPSSSTIPLSARQGGLKAFFNAFIAAYSPILHSTHPIVVACGQHMCRDDASAQELELFRKAGKHTYKNSSVTTLVSLKKRDQIALKMAADVAASTADEHQGASDLRERVMRVLGEGCTETGTAAQVDRKRQVAETRRKGKLDTKRLQSVGFICPVDELERYEYMASIPDEWEGQGSCKTDAVGEVHDCERCGKKYTVGGELNETKTERIPADPKACRYHWGKRRFEKVSGIKGRTQVWSCCDRQVGSSVLGEDSCCFGPHVFKETKALDLHRREAFITTAQLMESVRDHAKETEPLQIVAMDCELSYSTAGLSLTRLTLVDEEGEMLLDELVRCHADIVDYNTRFSGITAQEYEDKAIFTLRDVRKTMARFIGENTVLVGHGLENDLRAMRLVHTRVVDTVMLFPHARGFPFRNSLRDLTAKHLGRLIQNGTSLGHSSLEDAAMSLELVRFKMTHDPTSPFNQSKQHEKSTTTTVTTAAAPSATALASIFGPSLATSRARSVFRS